MLSPSDPRITSAMTNDASAVTLLSQLHLEIAHSTDPIALATSLGLYTAIAAARAARRHAPAPLRSAVASPYEAMLRARSSLAQPNLALQMSNLAIQMIMSQYNQSETLASSLIKKRDDAPSGVIQKIG